MMKIIRSDECNEAIKCYFKSLIDKGQQDVDVVNASAELIDIINEIPPAQSIIEISITEEMVQKALEKAMQSMEVEMGITIEKCVDKQLAKKPSFEGDGYADGHLVYDTWICPCCEKHYEVDYEEYDFCPNCGQKIDWKVDGDSDEEDD